MVGLREWVDAGDAMAVRLLRGVARRARWAYERMAHPSRSRAALRRLRQRPVPQSVLVVCHGNICRSPYAAALLQRGLGPVVGTRVRVTSAGFVLPGRRCPELAVEVAAARGLDLSGHRSQVLTPPEVAAADLILVMDTTQRWGVRALFGRSSDDVVLLGDLDPKPIETREIRDPFDQTKEVFELSYSRIERCVGELVRAISIAAQSVSSPGTPPDSERGRREQTA